MCLMLRRPPRYSRTYTLFPCRTLFRSRFALALRTEQLQVQRERRDKPQHQHRGGRQRPAAAQFGAFEPALQLFLFGGGARRSEEHTSELQSLMRISYAVFRLKKNT